MSNLYNLHLATCNLQHPARIRSEFHDPKIHVCVAWPYAAGDRHIGHLAGAYLLPISSLAITALLETRC